jgi:hypothetical protein
MDPSDPQYINSEVMKAYYAFMEKYQPDADASESNNVLGYLVDQTRSRP